MEPACMRSFQQIKGRLESYFQKERDCLRRALAAAGTGVASVHRRFYAWQERLA
jgi:hypothetical protein